ncbi:hypothetical protein [Mycobacterium noviomagense]|uniref:ESX-1 secretion-associated protein n=1 Tax=Mycobacterium noviomagense TaxID=459858 RepID=A0A7I7PCZ4_9MYCO|nr:hypothetical protein [Mycobacterium noviomagense]ORB16551.1 hypothetical protein BST37_06535 [Mycobacterium noviomagense]BBY06481.1 hypothetical protein MNVI_17990 [Mycobacterium noviomagense]
MAEVLRVPEALRAVASRCGALASEVAAGEAPVSGPSSRPSAAACSAGHAGVAAVQAASAARMQATRSALSAAKTAYDDNEDQSAAKLRAVGGQVV